MAHDATCQPQPDPKSAGKRRTAAEQGAPSLGGPDELHEVDLGDEKAARALDKIEGVRRKLEPRG